MAAIDVVTQTPTPKQLLKTLIIVLLDRSGSMESKRADVIGGYNRFLKEQKALTVDSCRLFGTQFNTEFNIMQPIGPIQVAVELSELNYIPGGSTALLDAFMHTMVQAEKEKQADERALMLIITDGEENSSRETTYESVAKMVKAKESQGDWTFTYLGVSLDKWTNKSGFAVGNAQQYNVEDPKKSFIQASHSTSELRTSSNRSTKDFYRQTPPGDVLNK